MKNEDIVRAISKKFSDVPKEGFAVGALLSNRGREYVNTGTKKSAQWTLILPRQKLTKKV